MLSSQERSDPLLPSPRPLKKLKLDLSTMTPSKVVVVRDEFNIYFDTPSNDIVKLHEIPEAKFNEHMGKNAFHTLISIWCAFMVGDDEKLDQLMPEISGALAEYAAVITHDGRYFIHSYLLKRKEPFVFLDKLSNEFLNRTALSLKQWEYPTTHNLLAILVQHRPARLLNHYLSKLTTETCDQLALDQNTLTQMVKHASSSIMLTFFHKLSDKTFDALDLVMLEDSKLFFERLLTGFNDEVCNYFVTKLSPEACERISRCLITQANLLVARESTYRLFINKLSPEEKVKRILDYDLNRDGYSSSFNTYALSILFEYPTIVKKYYEKNTDLVSLQIYDGGYSRDYWSMVTKQIVYLAPPPKKMKKNKDLSYILDQKNDMPFEPKTQTMMDLIPKDWKFKRLQGRTLVFENASGESFALKLKKGSESKEEFIKEYHTTKYLFEHREELALKSEIPEPIGVFMIKEFDIWYLIKIYTSKRDLIDKLPEGTEVELAYLYKAPKGYLTYIHESKISDKNFKDANRASVHDFYRLMQKGVLFHQPADLFHNIEKAAVRRDKGRYLVLTNLLNRDNGGNGRLTAWLKAVEFPNVRQSGLADFGDRMSLNDVVDPSEWVKTHYSFLTQDSPKVPNYLLAEFMAKYQYVLFLNAGSRGVKLTQSAREEKQPEENIFAIWEKLSKQVMENAAYAVSLLTKVPEKKVLTHLLSKIKVELLAKQMQYWMTGDYIPDVMKNTVRKDIYDPSTEIIVHFEEFRENTFNRAKGCSIDGINPDLGPVNGQEPIKEANKLFYWMVTYVFYYYLNFQKTIQDFHTLHKEKDFESFNKRRKSLFNHLPTKEHHAIQMALCEEMLNKPKFLTASDKTNLTAEAKTHAATILLGFWRERKIAKNEKQPKEVKKFAPFHS